MPARFLGFLQQVQRYCEKSLISRKVLPLWCHGQQCSSAASHLEFEMEDAAAGWGLVFSTLFCKQCDSCKKHYMGRLTSAYPEKKHRMWFTMVFQWVPLLSCVAKKSASQVLHCTGRTDIRDLFGF